MGILGDAAKTAWGSTGGLVFGGGSSPGGTLGFLTGGNTPQAKGYGLAAPQQFQTYQTPGLQGYGQPAGGAAPGQPAPTWANGEVKSNPNATAFDFANGVSASQNRYFNPKLSNTMMGMMQPAEPAAGGMNAAGQPQQPQRVGPGAPGGGQLATPPQGWDFTSPGVMEQTFNQQQGKFFAPSQANQFIQQNQQTFKNPGEGEAYWKGISNNFGAPGTAETWYGDNASRFAAPGAGQQYWNQVQGNMNSPTASSQYFDQFQQQEPGLGQYYDRAKERTAGSINDQLAARGGYGSSRGLGLLGDAMSGLEAERANREADYSLRQAQTGGQLAQAADAANLGKTMGYGNLAGQAGSQDLARLMGAGQFAGQAQTQGLNRMVQGGNLANAAQTMGQGRVAQGAALNQMGQADDVSRLMSGMNAANMAQSARRQRGRDYMSDVYAPSADMARYTNQGMNQALMNDQALMDSSIAFQTGLAADAVNAGYRNAEKQKADASWGLGMMGSIMSGGMF